MAVGSVGKARVKPGGPFAKDNVGCPVFSSKFKSLFSETDLILTTSFVNRFTYTGTGKFIGFVFRFDKSEIQVKLTIDSDIIFDIKDTEIDDIQVGAPASVGPFAQPTAGGPMWESFSKTYLFVPPCPIAFGTDVKIDVKKFGIPTTTLERHIINLTQET